MCMVWRSQGVEETMNNRQTHVNFKQKQEMFRIIQDMQMLKRSLQRANKRNTNVYELTKRKLDEMR